MAEQVTNAYQLLFGVQLLHHYWLDDGGTVFDQIATQATKDSRLLTYDMRPYLSVAPTESTAKTLSANRCLFRETNLGFAVAAPVAPAIPANTVLEFAVTVASGQFYDYTALTLRPQKIYEIFNPADGIIYRYKENVAVLSNLTGATRGVGPNLQLFLSQEIPAPAASDAVEALVLSGPALAQLTSDNPGATTQTLAAVAANLPVFVNQADAPAIVPPAGLVGAPARGVQLTADIPDDTFALISLTAVRGDNDAFSFVDGGGSPKATPPQYQVRFKNRSTTWTYLDKGTGTVSSVEANPLPLTFFGNAGTKQKPSRGHVKAQFAGTKVTGLISEIYV